MCVALAMCVSVGVVLCGACCLLFVGWAFFV